MTTSKIVTISQEEPQADMFVEPSSEKVVLLYKSIYDRKPRRMEVMAFGISGAKARIECICVRDTIRHMINARDTKAGHYSETVWRTTQALRSKSKMLAQGADRIKLAVDLRKFGIIDMLKSIMPATNNRYYRNYRAGIDALEDFVAMYSFKILV